MQSTETLMDPKKKRKPKTRARRGTGSIMQMPGSRFWWIQYYRNGQRIRESSKSELKSVAQSLLDKRRKEIQQGANPAISKKLTYADLRKGLLDFYANQNRRTLTTAKQDIKVGETILVKKGEKYIWGLPHLDCFFSGYKVQDITTGVLQTYVDKCKSEGTDGGTIRRRFNLLRAAFNIARKSGLVHYVPHFPMPKENDARQGFIEKPQFDKLLEHLPEHLYPLVHFLYSTGVRLGEARQIVWSQVDLVRGEIRLAAKQAKTGVARVLPLTKELLPMLKKPAIHVENEPVFNARNLRKEWEKAVKAAGMPNLLIHDFRRSAVRNMRKHGVSENVAMKISGHKTAAVFRRYDIVDTSDVHAAMDAVENGYKAESK
jgi:integrase